MDRTQNKLRKLFFIMHPLNCLKIVRHNRLGYSEIDNYFISISVVVHNHVLTICRNFKGAYMYPSSNSSYSQNNFLI